MMFYLQGQKIEIKSIVGFDESIIFVGDLIDMYSKYIEKNNWKILFMNSSTSSVGVFSNIVFNVLGKGIYSKSKYGSIVLVMPEEKN